MASRDYRSLTFAVHEKVSEIAFKRAEVVTPSRFLAAGMRLVYFAGVATQGFIEGAIEYDAYWALPLHDGRGEIVKPPGRGRGKWLVFFPDPNNDPRIQPVPFGYPVRVRQIRKLTEAEFMDAIAENKARGYAASGLSGLKGQTPAQEPFVIVTKRVRGFDGYRWLETAGIGGMVGVADEIATSHETARAFGRELRKLLPKGVRTARMPCH